MMEEPADFLSDPSDRPENGWIEWVDTADGVRLRLALWPAENARGTVFMFSGRTEYIEKYGHDAVPFVKAGFSVATLDWRGQGLSERTDACPNFGHVAGMREYQNDWHAVRDAAMRADMPEPFYLLAHSMGGNIGLRTVLTESPFKAVTFSAPMWAIGANLRLRLFGASVSGLLTLLGSQHKPMPFAGVDNFVMKVPFEGNSLTSDRAEWDHLGQMLRDNPGLRLGRPTCGWVWRVMKECWSLSRTKLPELPVLIIAGSDERVVHPQAIKNGAARWPSAKLEIFEGCRHEILVENPKDRNRAIAMMIDHFSSHP